MPSLYTKIALGIDWDDETLELVALGRRFREFVVMGSLRLRDLQADETRRKVEEFLSEHRIREARVTACLPRSALVVRFLDLPSEAESQLAKVVTYQIDVLHPFQSAPVSWDCAIVGRDEKAKQIRVLVVLAETGRLDRHYQLLVNLGLQVQCLTLGAANLSSWIGALFPEAAVVVCGRESGVELMGFYRGSLYADRYLPSEPSESASERFERELHSMRAVLPAPDPMALPLFVCGSMPAAFSELLSQAPSLPDPKLRLSAPAGFDPRVQLLALAAAYVSLKRKPAYAINLLPPEQRRQPKRWMRVPIYAFGTAAALLALTVTGHSWIETELYSRALDWQTRRLESQAAQVRQQDQQIGALAARATLLEGARQKTWQKLRLLEELSKLLPDGTWLQEVQLEEGTAELYGYSDRAADLVQLLENSPYFSQVEFAAPIIRGAQNKEVFRMRMRLGKPPRP